MFRSNQDTTCTGCNQPIRVGDAITWSRKSSGVYHPQCHPSRVRVIVATPETAPIAPAIAPVVAAPVAPVSNPTTNQPQPKRYELPAFEELKQNAPWWSILAQLTRALDRILIVGPPSSGKSTTATKTLNIEHRITMTPNTSREDLVGMFQLISGQTIWVDGPITKAMRNGQPVLIDEIDRCGAEVESLMYSVIDDKPHLSLPNGELVHANSGYKVLMTSNVTPESLEPAVVDRMPAIVFAFTPHEDALSGVRDSLATMARNHYAAQVKPRLRLSPTVRRVRAFESLLAANIPARIAANVVFGEGAAPEIQSVIANLEASEAK